MFVVVGFPDSDIWKTISVELRWLMSSPDGTKVQSTMVTKAGSPSLP